MHISWGITLGLACLRLAACVGQDPATSTTPVAAEAGAPDPGVPLDAGGDAPAARAPTFCETAGATLCVDFEDGVPPAGWTVVTPSYGELASVAGRTSPGALEARPGRAAPGSPPGGASISHAFAFGGGASRITLAFDLFVVEPNVRGDLFVLTLGEKQSLAVGIGQGKLFVSAATATSNSGGAYPIPSAWAHFVITVARDGDISIALDGAVAPTGISSLGRIDSLVKDVRVGSFLAETFQASSMLPVARFDDILVRVE